MEAKPWVRLVASWFYHLYLGRAGSLDNLLTMSKVFTWNWLFKPWSLGTHRLLAPTGESLTGRKNLYVGNVVSFPGHEMSVINSGPLPFLGCTIGSSHLELVSWARGSGCDPWFILRFMQAGCAFPSCSERKMEKGRWEARAEPHAHTSGGTRMSSCFWAAEGPSQSCLNFRASLWHSPQMWQKVRHEAGCCQHVFFT